MNSERNGNPEDAFILRIPTKGATLWWCPSFIEIITLCAQKEGNVISKFAL